MPALVQILAYCLTGNKPLSETAVVKFTGIYSGKKSLPKFFISGQKDPFTKKWTYRLNIRPCLKYIHQFWPWPYDLDIGFSISNFEINGMAGPIDVQWKGKSIGFSDYTDLLWWKEYKQLVLPIDHFVLGSQDPSNVLETTHIWV